MKEMIKVISMNVLDVLKTDQILVILIFFTVNSMNAVRSKK